MANNLRPGEGLQRLVHALEAAINNNPSIRLVSPLRVPDKETGQPREHDVVLVFTLNHHELMTAMECRDRNRKVGVPDIEAFKEKCRGTGIHRGIIVSSTGFTKTAIKKAEALDVGCFGLEDAEQFNWCQAPGVVYQERDLLEGPSWEVSTAEPIDGNPQIYDGEDRPLDAMAMSRIAQRCLNMRPAEEALREDEEARTNPVTRVFVNEGASAFYVIDRNGRRVPLTRMVVPVRYQVRHKIIPFQFRQYLDLARGSQMAGAAIATIDEGGVRGHIVLHNVGAGVRVSFVPLPRTEEQT